MTDIRSGTSSDGGGLRPAFGASRTQWGLVFLLFVLAGVAWWWTVGQMRGMDDGPWTGLGAFGNGNILFNNFWSARARINGSPETVNIRATRGGPAILNPPGFDGAVGFSSDDRKRVVLNGDFYYNRYQQGADRRGRRRQPFEGREPADVTDTKLDQRDVDHRGPADR